MRSTKLAIFSLSLFFFASWAYSLSREERQWLEYGNSTIQFAGHTWHVKNGGPFEPGTNHFSDSNENVRVDSEGRLHLQITQREGQWYCAEIACDEILGYGDYIFQTLGRVDSLDSNAVLSLFLWEYPASYEGRAQTNVANQFTIDLSRWGDPTRKNVQYLCQPWQTTGNERRFELTLSSTNDPISHAFLWHPNGVACRTWNTYDTVPAYNRMLTNWFYSGKDTPRPGFARVHIGLWCFQNPSPNFTGQEVIVSGFHFIPTE